mgnify:CR=1 FL=1
MDQTKDTQVAVKIALVKDHKPQDKWYRVIGNVQNAKQKSLNYLSNQMAPDQSFAVIVTSKITPINHVAISKKI